MTDQRPGTVAALLPGLLRYARMLTRDPVHADDLVQDAMVAALANLDGHDGERPVRPWLMAILRNKFLSDRRRQRNGMRHISELVLAVAEDELGGQSNPADVYDATQLLNALPDEQREVLYLLAVEGLSYREISGALNVPVGTVMSRIARARAKLRSMEQNATNIPHLHVVRKEAGKA